MYLFKRFLSHNIYHYLYTGPQKHRLRLSYIIIGLTHLLQVKNLHKKTDIILKNI